MNLWREVAVTLIMQHLSTQVREVTMCTVTQAES